MKEKIKKNAFDNDFWLQRALKYNYKLNENTPISFVPFHLKNDIILLHHWVNLPYAKYWQLENSTLEIVFNTYKEIIDSQNTCVFWGVIENKKVFLVEFYYAPKDRIGKHYNTKVGDYGFHILTGPLEKKIPQLTTHIFVCLLSFLFENKNVKRVVVEPDIMNEKIHILNKRAGFIYEQKIQLEEKEAFLAFCDRNSFKKSQEKMRNSLN